MRLVWAVISLVLFAIIAMIIVMIFASTPVTIMPIDGSILRPTCVSEKYYCYTAENVTVNVGDVVRFSNPGPGLHSFVSGNSNDGANGEFGHDPMILLQPGEYFDWISHTAGEFEFFNALNPYMKGVITVVGESIEPEPTTLEEASEIARQKIILTKNTWENFPTNFTINSIVDYDKVLEKTIVVECDNRNEPIVFPVNYSIENGEVASIEKNGSYMNIYIEPQGYGSLYIEIPRYYFNARLMDDSFDFPFIVLLDGHEIPNIETQNTENLRTIHMDFIPNSSEITIIEFLPSDILGSLPC